jgi:hypothetical protein
MEIKTHRDHPSSMEQRIRDRLKPSAEPQRGDGAQVTLGSGPTRAVTTIHPNGNTRQHGEVHQGEGDINGNKRGVV